MAQNPPDNSKLLVISFDDALRAQEYLLAVSGLQTKDEIAIHDAVLISRDADGGSHVRETRDLTPTQAGLGAGFWGLLIGTLLGGPLGGIVVGAASAGGGALYAKLVDTGVKDETIAELRTAVPPGRTAVALLVSHISVGDLQRELARFPHAQLVETDLPPAAVSAVQAALSEADRAPFTG
jgi:uncharacterized membrane protein